MKKLIAITLLLAACTKTESSDILTSGVFAMIEAETAGDGKTLVTATLFDGNPVGLNYLELTGEDSLVAKAAGTSKTMIEKEILNTVEHQAEFPTDAAGAQFEVIFDRAIDAGAPSSLVTLPAKFDITTTTATASRAQMLMLGWAPAGTGDGMGWSAHGDCIEDIGTSTNLDDGAFVIQPNTLKKRMGTGIAEQCPVVFTIRRAKLGILDSHYGKGGNATGIQYRTITIMSTP